MNEFVERVPGGKLFHSCEHPPFSILRCITTLRLLAGVRDWEHIDLSGREGGIPVEIIRNVRRTLFMKCIEY